MSRLSRDIRELLSEQVHYHELLLRLTGRDVRVRYKQSLMGFGWAIFMPVFNTVLFSVIFTRVAPLDTGATPYPVYAYTGLMFWNAFSTAVRAASTSLSGNAVFVTKIYFPREILPFSIILGSLVDLAIAGTVLTGLLIYYGIVPAYTILLVPAILLVQVAFTAAVSLVVSMANLYLRDVKYIFEVVVNLWMFATSVVYPVEAVGGKLGTLMEWNPMTPIIGAYRRTILEGRVPDERLVLVAAVTLVFLAVAWVGFHRAEFKFAEYV